MKMLNQIKDDIIDILVESNMFGIARELKCDMLSYMMLLKEWGIDIWEIEEAPFGLTSNLQGWPYTETTTDNTMAINSITLNTTSANTSGTVDVPAIQWRMPPQ